MFIILLKVSCVWLIRLTKFAEFAGKVSSYFEMDILIGFYFLFGSMLLGYFQIIFNKKSSNYYKSK